MQKVIDDKLVELHKIRAAKSFAKYDFLIDYAAGLLGDKLADMTRHFSHILDIGYHAGYGLHHVPYHYSSATTMGRLSEPLIKVRADHVVMHEEFLPDITEKYDLVLSVSSLHWVNDLPGFLLQLRRCITKNGVFLANILGGKTLWELKDVLIKAESELYGGVSPRIIPFIEIKTLGGLLQRAGFDAPVTESQTVTVQYDSVQGLMRDLRLMGENNALCQRPRRLTRFMLERIEEMYRRDYSDSHGGIYVTFDFISMTAIAS